MLSLVVVIYVEKNDSMKWSNAHLKMFIYIQFSIQRHC